MSATYAQIAGSLDANATGALPSAMTVTESQVTSLQQHQLDPKALKGTALRRFWADLTRAKIGAGVCNILHIGTSISEGYGATTILTDRWQAKFRDNLRASHQPSGVAGGFGYLPVVWGNTGLMLPASMTLSGSPTNYGLYGLGRRSVIFQSSGQKATFTTPSDCTGFDIFWTRGSSFGVLYYKVDGGSAVTINTAGSAADGQITQVRGLSAASHTIEVGWSSGGQTFFSGCMLYNGDESTGIRSFDGAHSGAFSSLFTATEWQGCLATVAPSLVVLELGVNDPSAPLTATQFQTNLTTLIAAITAAVTPQPSYVLMLDWNRGDYSDATWTPFVTATKAVAAANSGVLVFDLYSRTYDTQTRATNNSLGILASDKIHPVNLGQQYIADTLYEFVKP